jgi:Fe2+ or Zn2+ uptake regulation protein
MTASSPGSSSGAKYSEASPFVRLLPTQGRVRILDVFLRKHYKPLTATEVAKLGDINPSTFHRNIDALIEAGVIKEQRKVAGTQLYQLNTDNPAAKIFGEARAELLENRDSVPESTDESELDNVIEEEENGIRIPTPDVEKNVTEGIREQSRRIGKNSDV